MSIQQLLFKNLSKGIRAGTLLASPEESADLTNLNHIAGALASTPAAETLAPYDNALSSDKEVLSWPVTSIKPYVDADGLTHYIGRRGKNVWLGSPVASFDRYEPGSGVYAQYTMSDPDDIIGDHAGGVAGYTLTNSNAIIEQLWSTNVRHFDGYSASIRDDSSASASNFNFGSGPRAVSAWIRIDGAGFGGTQMICGKLDSGQPEWYVAVDDLNRVFLHVSDGTNWVQATSTYTIPIGVWTLIYVSYDTTGGTNLYPLIYFNSTATPLSGSAVTNTSNGTITTVDSDNAAKFRISGDSVGAYPFNGAIGSLTVYNAVTAGLNAAQWNPERLRYFEQTSPYLPTPYRWRPLLVDAYDSNSSGMATRSRLHFDKERVEQVGYGTYFSPQNPGGNDMLMAWDGVIVDKIRVTNSWLSGPGQNFYAITNDPDFGLEGMYQFEAAGVQPGDILITQSVPNIPTKQWFLQGHVITKVCTVRGANYGVYTLAPQDASISSACNAAIVRVRQAGVLAASTAAAVDNTSILSDSTLAAGVYKYCYRYGNSKSGYYGNASVESTQNVETSPAIIDGAGNLAAGSLTVSAPGIKAGATVTAVYTSGSGPGTLSSVVTAGVGFVISSTSRTDTSNVMWSVTLTATIAVSGWSTTPPWNVDTIEIYRSDLGVAGAFNPYYRIAVLSLNTPTVVPMTAQTIYRSVPASWTDDGTNTPDTNTPLLEAVGHEAPGPIANLYQYNSRLYGSDIDADQMTMELSTLGQYEYWPGVEYDQVAATPTNANIGGAVQIGNSLADPITVLIPEVGTFITTGLQGSDLLVFTPTRAIRWNGNTALDFQVTEGISEGAINPALAVNAGPIIIFFDGDHFRSLSIGASASEIISYQLWPRGLRDYLANAGGITDVQQITKFWSACYKDGWYYVACTLSAGQINDRIYACHTASKTWTKLSASMEDICVGAIVGASNNPKLIGVSAAADVNGLYNLTDVLSGNGSLVINWISAPISFAKEPEHVKELKHITEITACFDSPIVTQSVTLSLYVNGDTTNAFATDTELLSVDPPVNLGSASPGKQIVTWTPPAHDGVILQVGVSATLTSPTALNWVQLNVETR